MEATKRAVARLAVLLHNLPPRVNDAGKNTPINPERICLQKKEKS